MEKIKVFKPRRKSAWFFMLFGSVIMILGIIALVVAFKSGFDTRFIGDWIYLVFITQGIYSLSMGISLIKYNTICPGTRRLKRSGSQK